MMGSQVVKVFRREKILIEVKGYVLFCQLFSFYFSSTQFEVPPLKRLVNIVPFLYYWYKDLYSTGWIVWFIPFYFCVIFLLILLIIYYFYWLSTLHIHNKYLSGLDINMILFVTHIFPIGSHSRNFVIYGTYCLMLLS
jgi:hypothetical protein